MTIEERAELAVETFAAGKGNCTQSVLCAWEDKIPVDHDTLMKLGAGYGAGMGCMQATCGALIGAVIAAGSVTDGKGTPRTARSILYELSGKKSGATICKDLKGVETGKVLCPCAQCVRNAVLAAGEMLGSKGRKAQFAESAEKKIKPPSKELPTSDACRTCIAAHNCVRGCVHATGYNWS